MKSIIRAALVATALVVPVASFAQSQITRAQVRAELAQLESVGYHVGDGDQAHYPEAIQAAETKLAARNGETAYGGAAGGTSQSGGSRVSQADWNAMYSR
ncbi:membrane protein [Caballeronia peredens]|nr:membrane protein [Caballeronia peredens]